MSYPLRRALIVAALALTLPACGKSKDDDDKPAASPPPPAQPPAPAAVTADPVDPTPTPPAAQPGAATPPGTAHPAGPSSGAKPKSQPAPNNNSPIPSALVPKPLQPLVPKVPAGVLP